MMVIGLRWSDYCNKSLEKGRIVKSGRRKHRKPSEHREHHVTIRTPCERSNHRSQGLYFLSDNKAETTQSSYPALAYNESVSSLKCAGGTWYSGSSWPRFGTRTWNPSPSQHSPKVANNLLDQGPFCQTIVCMFTNSQDADAKHSKDGPSRTPHSAFL